MKRDKGVALISMLITSLLLVTLVLSIIFQTKVLTASAQTLKNYSDYSLEFLSLESKLIYLLSDQHVSQVSNSEKQALGLQPVSWQNNHQWQKLTDKVEVHFSDEAGRLSVTPFNSEHFGFMLSGLGIDRGRVTRILDCALDWVDADDLKRLSGEESFYYKTLGFDNFPRNAPFESVSELQYICGMDNVLYEKIRPNLTSYGVNYLNLLSANESVLRGMFNEDIVTALLGLRNVGNLNRNSFLQITQFAETESIRLSFSPILRVKIRYSTESGTRMHSFVINRRSTQLMPVQVFRIED